jgi:hypothetical protein
VVVWVGEKVAVLVLVLVQEWEFVWAVVLAQEKVSKWAGERAESISWEQEWASQ